MDPIAEPREKSFDAHYNYLLQVVNEWVEMVNQTLPTEVGADTLAWIEAHKGLLWLYENALDENDPSSQEAAEMGLNNFYGVGHALSLVVSQFSWRPDYPFHPEPRPSRRKSKEEGS